MVLEGPVAPVVAGIDLAWLIRAAPVAPVANKHLNQVAGPYLLDSFKAEISFHQNVFEPSKCSWIQSYIPIEFVLSNTNINGYLYTYNLKRLKADNVIKL